MGTCTTMSAMGDALDTDVERVQEAYENGDVNEDPAIREAREELVSLNFIKMRKWCITHGVDKQQASRCGSKLELLLLAQELHPDIITEDVLDAARGNVRSMTAMEKLKKK